MWRSRVEAVRAMRVARIISLSLALVCAMGGGASALIIPINIKLPSPIVNVGDTFQITILVDTAEVPTGLASAGVRLYGADPFLDVTGIIPGSEFSPLTGVNDLDLDPPDPGLFEMVPILGPGAYGPILAVLEVTAVAPGAADLSLGFWDASPLFENFAAWWDETPPDPSSSTTTSFSARRGSSSRAPQPYRSPASWPFSCWAASSERRGGGIYRAEGAVGQ